MHFRIFSYSNIFSYHHLLAPDPKKRLMHEYCKILAKIRKLKGTNSAHDTVFIARIMCPLRLVSTFCIFMLG